MSKNKTAERILAEALEHTLQPFVIGYLDGRLGCFNAAYFQMLGYRVPRAVREVNQLPENMPQIYEPLFSTKAHGIGLGVPLSKNLVESNGDRIWAENDPRSPRSASLGLVRNQKFPNKEAVDE
jgi:hypothetical protein